MHRRSPFLIALALTAGLTAGVLPATLANAAAPDVITPIADIQGDGSSSPLQGQQVTTVGVVTAAYPTGGFNGFYLQTPGTGGSNDATPNASDGVFVYGTTDVASGDCYQVAGRVTEYYGLTELTRVSLTPVDECSPVEPVPLAELPGTEADREALEGMLVQPQGEWTITNNYQLNQYGQLGLTPGVEPLYQSTDVVAPGPDADAYEVANQARLITLDDGSSWDYLRNTTAQDSPLPYLSQATPLRTGSQVTFSTPVILDYRYQWNFQPLGQVVGADSPLIPVAGEDDRPTGAPAVGGNVQIAAFNVLNYFTDLGEDEAGCAAYTDRDGTPVTANYCQVRGAYTPEAFAMQEAKIVAAINASDADVIALMEIENSAGITYLPGQVRDTALAHLVESLNAAGGDWAYVPSPTVTPATEDVIRTGFIYRPDQVQLLGPSIIQLDDAFANARYPLAQKFKARQTGKPFVVIANHFKSKGSGEDDGTGQGLSNPSREAQAAALTAWSAELFSDEAVFLMGDFNAYTKETPVQIIEAAGFTNVAAGYGADPTYQFSGRLGSLDHAFANAAAMRLVTGAAVWNINADESVAMQYSRSNYNVTQFVTDSMYAASDHDPVILGLDTRAQRRGNG